MSRNIFVLAGALLAAALMPTLAAAQASPNASHPCAKVIDCDCETIDAGLLTGGWRTDCRSCQKNIRNKCMEAYTGMPLYRAMTAGGYCENACSVTGDNPKPKAPAAVPESNANDAPMRSAQIRLRCELDEKWTVEDHDGVIFSGCSKGANRNGLWVGQNSDGDAVVEILYKNGKEVWRKTLSENE